MLVFLLILTGLASVALWLKQNYWTDHTLRMSHQKNLAKVTCWNCHLVSTARLRWAKPRPHHDAPGGLAVSPDGRKIYIALDDRDEVAEADTISRRVLRRAKVAGQPSGLALDAAGKNLFVTCRDGDRLAVLETQTLQETGTIAVGMAPVAVAFCRTAAGDRLVVANSMSDDISVLSVSPLQELGRPAAGREPFAVAVTPDGARAFVANRMVRLAPGQAIPASEITEIDPITARTVGREALDSAHLSEAICAVPSRSWMLTPLVKVRNLVPITQVANGWVMSSGLAVTDVKTGNVTEMPLDEANDYFADPSGVVVDPAGRRAYVASGGGDVVTVVDLERLAGWLDKADPATKQEAIYDMSLSPEYVTARIPTRRNPKQMALSPDGGTMFVAERLADSILVVDTKSLGVQGRIVLGDGGLNDPIRRGERIFTKAGYTFQSQFSCRSCHPDGHVDGLSYDFDTTGIGDNLLDNRSLMGVAGTEPFKWNGKNPSLEVQCGPRFARVLMRTDPIPQKELLDLTTFIKSLPPQRAMTRSADGKLTPSQERGKAVFFATTTPDGREIPHERRCSTCHRPPLYSVRLSFDVGTGGMFDTPHLLGVANTAPYLHDGRAQTLEELWTTFNTNDLHGVSSYMNKIQLNDLIDFLKTL
jgi:DNA-binding beta-propeller fold protein YncE